MLEKMLLTLSLLILSVIFLKGQQKEKTITIKDKRDKGIEQLDTTCLGYQSGDLYVSRVQTVNSLKKESVEAYSIHFLRPFKSGLRNYNLKIITNDNFDKASYDWLKDSVVSVTLFNSTTKQKRNLKLIQPPDSAGCCSAGILAESLEGKKEEK